MLHRFTLDLIPLLEWISRYIGRILMNSALDILYRQLVTKAYNRIE